MKDIGTYSRYQDSGFIYVLAGTIRDGRDSPSCISIFSDVTEKPSMGEVKAIETGLLCLILAGAAWTDAFDRRVKNWWLVIGTMTGIGCRGRDFFPAALAVLAVSFLLFEMRVMGAGDGKLMAVIAGYLGMSAGMEAIFTGMLIGALWSLCRLWHSKGLKAYLIYLAAYFVQIFQTGITRRYCEGALKNPERTIPLAPCMAAGTYLYLMLSGAAAVWAER